MPGIDLKARGGYVLAPPSVHPSGHVYTKLCGDVPVRVEALSDILPAELLASHTEKPKTVSSSPVIINDPWEHAEHPISPDRSLVEQIKERYRIEQFFNRLYSQKRGYYMTHCPFHDDRHPSMWVDVENQYCGCFAGCTDKPLDVIDLYARFYNLSIQEAIRLMKSGGVL